MSERKAKRFWKVAEAVEVDGAWQISLDGKPVKTPARAPLAVPSRALADAIAAEWDAQDGDIDPSSMPLTRSANAAIDKVVTQFEDVAQLVWAYGETDLCCYRADGPQALTRQQADAWDALLDWARTHMAAPLTTTVGVLPVAQPESSLAELHRRVSALDAFALTALHDLVALSGSLLIGLAVVEDAFPPEDLWRRSRIDETFQESQWGVDDEAAAMASRKRSDFLHAARFLRLSRQAA